MRDIPNDLSILAQISDLLENFSFDEPFYELKEYCISLVDEMVVPTNMRHGDIWGCDFEYKNITPGLDPLNPLDMKNRPCVIINDRDFGFVALRISHVDTVDPKTKRILTESEIQKKYNTRFKYILEDWSTEGLNMRSYAYCIDVRQIINIPNANSSAFGHISSRDFKQVLRKFNYFKAYRDRKIVLFNQYLKFANFRYASKGTFQTIKDLDASGKVSLVDIANLISQLCHRLRIKYKILWTVLKTSDNRQYNQFTCMYTHKNFLSAFRYFPQMPDSTELHLYEFVTKFEDVIDDETNWIKQYYPVKDIVSASSRYLEADELKLWKQSSNNKARVEDFIKDLEKIAKSNGYIL